MESVSLRRSFEGDPGTVRDAMLSLEPFVLAVGFDKVPVDGGDLATATA